MKPSIVTSLSLLAGLVNQVAGTFVIFNDDDGGMYACGGEGAVGGSGNSCPCMVSNSGAEVTANAFDITTSNFSVVNGGAGGLCGKDQLDFYHETVPWSTAPNLVFYIHNGDGTPAGACTPQNSNAEQCDGGTTAFQIIYECFDGGAICSN